MLSRSAAALPDTRAPREYAQMLASKIVGVWPKPADIAPAVSAPKKRSMEEQVDVDEIVEPEPDDFFDHAPPTIDG